MGQQQLQGPTTAACSLPGAHPSRPTVCCCAALLLVQVMVAQVDSHKLFRMAADVQGCVVLVRERSQLPEPYQLAAALKKAPARDAH
jgi:hypothetical protein